VVPRVNTGSTAIEQMPLHRSSRGGAALAAGDLMRLNGWRTRAVIDRYTSDVAEERALPDKKRMGDLY